MTESCAPAVPRVFQWGMDSGYLTMTFHAEMSSVEDEEVEAVLAITVGVMRRAAQAIEARRAETGTGSVHESAVAESDAPNATSTPSPDSKGGVSR